MRPLPRGPLGDRPLVARFRLGEGSDETVLGRLLIRPRLAAGDPLAVTSESPDGEEQREDVGDLPRAIQRRGGGEMRISKENSAVEPVPKSVSARIAARVA